MIANDAAMPPENRPPPCPPQLLELAGAQAEVKGRLLGRKEGASLFCPRSATDFVIHDCLTLSRQRRGKARGAADAFRMEPIVPSPARHQRSGKTPIHPCWGMATEALHG